MIEVNNSNLDDLKSIFRLYDFARSLQKSKNAVIWPEFDPAFIQAEILEKGQWKLIINNIIAGVWVTTFSDPYI